MYEIVPGFIVCTVAIVIVSLLDKVPTAVETKFEEADLAYQSEK